MDWNSKEQYGIPTYLPTYLLTYLPTYLPTYLLTYLLTYLPTYLPTYLRTYLPTYLPTYYLREFACELTSSWSPARVRIVVPSRGPCAISAGCRWLPLAAAGCGWLPSMPPTSSKIAFFVIPSTLLEQYFGNRAAFFIQNVKKEPPVYTKRELGLQELIWDRANKNPRIQNSRPVR